MNIAPMRSSIHRTSFSPLRIILLTIEALRRLVRPGQISVGASW